MAKPIKTWILVADGAEARVLSKAGAGQDLIQLDPGVIHGMNLRSHEIMSDRAGRTFDSVGAGRHAKEPRTDPRQIQEQRFIQELTARLEIGAQKGAFDRLVIVAPPRTLGELRSAFSDRLRSRLTGVIGKNLVHLTEPALKRRLTELVWP